MSGARKVLGIVVIATVAFLAGVATAVLRGWGDSAVRVKVINSSDHVVESFTVRYTTCGSKAQLIGGPVAPGQSQTMRFPVCGEGGYFIEANLADGRVIKGMEGYVESGYSATDTVTSKGIESRQRAYAL